MHKTRHVKLALLFGLYSALVATIVSIVAAVILGIPIGDKALISAASSGVGVFVVGFLTVLFVWPRIGFDPFDSRRHEQS